MSLRDTLARLEHEHWTVWVEVMLQKTQPLAAYAQFVTEDPAARSLVAGETFYSSWDIHDSLDHHRQWQKLIVTPYEKLSGKDKDPCRDHADKVLVALHETGHYWFLAQTLVRAWGRGVYDDRTLYEMLDFGLVNGPSDEWPEVLVDGWSVAKVPGPDGSWPSEDHIEEMIACCKKYLQEVS